MYQEKQLLQEDQSNLQILVALVENKPGVLNRVVSLFRRRNFNIDSLTVGRTHKPHVSRMTIVVDANRADAQLIKANLQKLVNVIDVRLLSKQPHVSRDLALIKVRANNPEARNLLTTICERYPTRIIDIGPEMAVLEVVARAEIIEDLIAELGDPLSIVEMIRTGVVAMGRGTRVHDTQYQANGSSGSNGNIRTNGY